MNQYLESRPHTVRAVPIDTPGAQEYLAETIVTDLEIFLNQPFPNREEVKNTVKSIIEKPDSEYIVLDRETAEKAAKGASLEIEDLGLTVNDVAQTLQNWFTENQSVSLDQVLIRDFEFDEGTAEYLADVLSYSIEQVGKRQKMNFLKSEIEKIVGNPLGDEFQFIFYQVLDSQVYIPDEEGDVTVSYRLTGSPIISDMINSRLFTDQQRSMIVAFAVIFLLLWAQLKNLKRSVFAYIPLALTVYTSFGIMGLFRIPLNVATLMVASIAIGAGIDYTVHFI